MHTIIIIRRSLAKVRSLNGVKPETMPKLPVVLLALCLFFIIVPACNPEEWVIPDCSGCVTDKPSEARINVKLSLNELNTSVVINIYSGRIEEEVIILSDTVRTETWSVILPVDEYYTVTATYRSSANYTYYNVTAIDGGVVRAKMIETRCDRPCWVIRGNNFNVKLKY